MAALERMVDARTNAQHSVQAQLDQVQNEVNELRGMVELHSHKLEQILERQRELYLEIDKRIDAVMNRPASPGADLSGMTPDTPAAGSASEQEAYDRAVNLILRDKRYDQAIPEFEAFLKAYPNSSFAANARYWLGQLLFNKQDWSGAASHFDKVISEFPDSNKRADSLLKLGMIAQNQANLARAQQLYEQVIREYPDSSARKLAEPRLRTLKAN
ncbi:tol-pal system protein YbgF [Bowmanella denitrificans]|uniref:Cell division coordinator CpoB n=2 Tax=Bowmanella denitrificans TaxID=366582 RepID=A0ABN0X0L8_9ALTE